LAVLVPVLSFVLAFATFKLGYHNEDLDYHLCTGRNPLVNINQVRGYE
jgi:hypothetical protein